MNITLPHLIFAPLDTVANMAAQDTLLRVYGSPMHMWALVLLGTGVGFVVKYVLDKRYIFCTRDAAKDGRTFALHAALGLVTTAIFLGFEFAFHVWFHGARGMRYLGGRIGVALGYWAKYCLVKRYVFIKATA